MNRQAFAVLLVTVGSAAGYAQLQPPWNIRAKLGEVSEIKASAALLASPDIRPYLEKALDAGDDVGLKELVAAGKMSLVDAGTKVLIIDVDESRYRAARKELMSVVDVKIEGYKDCLRRDMERVRKGFPQLQCEEPNINREFSSIYSLVYPKLAPADFVERNVFARVRILDGPGKDGSGWLRLADIVLPTRTRCSPQMPLLVQPAETGCQ